MVSVPCSTSMARGQRGRSVWAAAVVASAAAARTATAMAFMLPPSRRGPRERPPPPPARGLALVGAEDAEHEPDGLRVAHLPEVRGRVVVTERGVEADGGAAPRDGVGETHLRAQDEVEPVV